MAVVPGMTELTAPYWDAARGGRLVVQECQECHMLRHPPLPECPSCQRYSRGSQLGWREMSGEGTVYTYTVVRHPTHFAFAGKVPYVLAIVELTEGPRLVTALTGIEPDEVCVGLPVRVVFREVADGVTLSYFEPAVGPRAEERGSLGGPWSAQRSTILPSKDNSKRPSVGLSG